MTYHIIGNSVENAGRYELLERIGEEYVFVAASTRLDFNLSELGLATGEHVFAVQAKANGYKTSGYSNEVTCTVE